MGQNVGNALRQRKNQGFLGLAQVKYVVQVKLYNRGGQAKLSSDLVGGRRPIIGRNPLNSILTRTRPRAPSNPILLRVNCGSKLSHFTQMGPVRHTLLKGMGRLADDFEQAARFTHFSYRIASHIGYHHHSAQSFGKCVLN